MYTTLMTSATGTMSIVMESSRLSFLNGMTLGLCIANLTKRNASMYPRVRLPVSPMNSLVLFWIFPNML